MYTLNIYRVIDGTDEWPLIDTITGVSEQICLDRAEYKYDQDAYHWTNPVRDANAHITDEELFGNASQDIMGQVDVEASRTKFEMATKDMDSVQTERYWMEFDWIVCNPITINAAVSLAAQMGTTITAIGIRRACQRGYVKAKKIGRDWLVNVESLRAYLSNRPKPGRQAYDISIDNGNSTCTPGEAIKALDWDVIVNAMDDDIRETVHTLRDWGGDNLGFLREYLKRAPITIG